MNTHVDSHLLRLAESSAASVALEGFFTGVSTDMLSQMISPPKTFSAIWTLEHGNWSLRSHNCHSQRLKGKNKIFIDFYTRKGNTHRHTKRTDLILPGFGQTVPVVVRPLQLRQALQTQLS